MSSSGCPLVECCWSVLAAPSLLTLFGGVDDDSFSFAKPNCRRKSFNAETDFDSIGEEGFPFSVCSLLSNGLTISLFLMRNLPSKTRRTEK